MATLITIDGAESTITPANPTEGFTLTELYAAIGADIIEVVYLDDGRLMVIDEEGKLNGKQPNRLASEIAESVLQSNDYIVGNAVIASTQEVQ